MKISWNYVAGFFDGEGCVSTTPKTSATLYGAFGTKILIGQSGPIGEKILKLIREFLESNGIKAYLVACKPKQVHHQVPWAIRIEARSDVEKFLSRMLPLVVVKKSVVQDTLRFLKMYPSLRGGRPFETTKHLDVALLKSDRSSGMTYKAIAAKHNVSATAVKSRLIENYNARSAKYRTRIA